MNDSEPTFNDDDGSTDRSPNTWAACLAQARAALDLPPPDPAPKESVVDFARRVLGVDILRCPICREGRMRLVETLPRSRGPPDHV